MKYNITIIGAGYIGLTTGVCFANAGHKITLVDVDKEKIKMLENGKSPIFEPGLSELLTESFSNLSFTTNYDEGLKNAEIVFIAVTTPSKINGEADLSFVKSASESIGKSMKSDLVIVNRSTAPIGTGKMLEKIIQSKTKYKVSVISCPEFLREGTAIHDFFYPDRIVIGAEKNDTKAVELLEKIYSSTVKNKPEFLVTDIKSAEMIKYASNSFLATQISFINELAILCDKLNVDITNVAKGMKMDSRIGEKAFLNAGLGYGGSCFPKDIKALIALGKKFGKKLQILEKVNKINDSLIDFAFSKIKKLLRKNNLNLSEVKVCFLGLSFKPNTDDTRESQAIKLLEKLCAGGAKNIHIYDPVVVRKNGVENFVITKKLKKHMAKLLFCKTLDEACNKADIIVLATEWEEFKTIDLAAIKKQMKTNLFVDLRNVFSKNHLSESGFDSENIARE